MDHTKKTPFLQVEESISLWNWKTRGVLDVRDGEDL